MKTRTPEPESPGSTLRVPEAKPAVAGAEGTSNARRLVAGRAEQGAGSAAACCSPGAQETCCAPSQKATCCAPDTSSCGCA